VDTLNLPWRVGRHNKQIVYALWGTEASDDDEMVAVFIGPDGEQNAADCIAAHNAALEAG
jgi:hypothetical protein